VTHAADGFDLIARGYAALRQASPAGVIDLIPAYASLSLILDPSHARDPDRRAQVEVAATRAFTHQSATSPLQPRVVDIPFCADGDDFALDVRWLASHLGMTPDAILDCFTSARYRVAFLGFSPGFPYLQGLPKELHVPRLESPRQSVPAGSVAIASSQAGIYPASTPGGWRILGRTPVRLFTPHAPSPTLLQPGDQVTFTRISRDHFDRLATPA
jgi:KipI family sensor histidine kinase inhibitor